MSRRPGALRVGSFYHELRENLYELIFLGGFDLPLGVIERAGKYLQAAKYDPVRQQALLRLAPAGRVRKQFERMIDRPPSDEETLNLTLRTLNALREDHPALIP